MSEDYDEIAGALSITDDVIEAEFRVATRQAVEDMQEVFLFKGYTIDTSEAVDVVQAVLALRTYH